MKANRKFLYIRTFYLILCFICFFLSSCEKYLDKTIKADITSDKIFTTFPTFQGFVEKMYCDVVDCGWYGYNPVWNYGDDVSLTDFYRTMQDGNYMSIMTTSGGSQLTPYTNGSTRSCTTGSKSVWSNGWMAIRDCNTGLSHIKDLVSTTTDEEKNVLKGQCYFFRAYFHWMIMKQWGNIPYCDTLFRPTDKMEIPQLSIYATAEKVLADFQRAADLLPLDWDATIVGQPTLGINGGRLTKGMAWAFMAEVSMWCGSPLFNGTETGNYVYNIDYCKKAASFAWKVIDLKNQGVYAMEPWATYNQLFKTDDATLPGRSKEVIFRGPFGGVGCDALVRNFILSGIGGEGRFMSVTQNVVELFEMENGLPINDPASGFVPLDPWNNRDPRFRNAIYVDQDRVVVNRNDAIAFAQFYTGGANRSSTSTETGFGCKKFIFTKWNTYDNQFSGGYITVPILRMADIYLFYAEAANEAYGGPSGKDPAANLTALDAVNIVRNRATMPNVNAKFLNQTDFRERIRNERSVELAFENKRRDDQRRWYIAHLPQYTNLYSCEFPKDHSSFTKVFLRSIQFQQKHYWFPYPPNQVFLYPGWKQNPGW